MLGSIHSMHLPPSYQNDATWCHLSRSVRLGLLGRHCEVAPSVTRSMAPCSLVGGFKETNCHGMIFCSMPRYRMSCWRATNPPNQTQPTLTNVSCLIPTKLSEICPYIHFKCISEDWRLGFPCGALSLLALHRYSSGISMFLASGVELRVQSKKRLKTWNTEGEVRGLSWRCLFSWIIVCRLATNPKLIVVLSPYSPGKSFIVARLELVVLMLSLRRCFNGRLHCGMATRDGMARWNDRAFCRKLIQEVQFVSLHRAFKFEFIGGR